MEEVKTIQQNAKAEVEAKKSKFIAQIFYIETVEEAEQLIKKIRKEYFDARHHCYAYRVLEKDGLKEKQSDDGEPSGTAGAPMLNILQKNQLLNTLVVVTRYFGGTLLGTGGLIRAYSEATVKAITEARIALQSLGCEISITIEYKDLEKFKYYCQKNEIQIMGMTYEKNIICRIAMTNTEKDKIIGKKQTDIKILEYAVLGEKYIRIKNKI